MHYDNSKVIRNRKLIKPAFSILSYSAPHCIRFSTSSLYNIHKRCTQVCTDVNLRNIRFIPIRILFEGKGTEHWKWLYLGRMVG
jgi:hypothetical protein